MPCRGVGRLLSKPFLVALVTGTFSCAFSDASVYASGNISDKPPNHGCKSTDDYCRGQGREGRQASGDPGGASGSGKPSCVWVDASSNEVDAIARSAGPRGQIIREDAGDPGLQVMTCDGDWDGRSWRVKPVPKPPTASELAAELYVEVSDTLPTPAVFTTPGDGVPSIVKVPVFVSVDPAQWADRPRRADDPSGLWVEAVARPTSMTFDPGDRTATISCTGPGAAYAGGDPWAQAGDEAACAHAYTRATKNADGTPVVGAPSAWSASVHVSWSVTWRASTGETGAFPAIVKTTALTRPVVEVATVITR